MDSAAALKQRTAIPEKWDGYATFTVEETCQIVRIGRSSAYKAVENGDIKSIRIGGRVLIPRAIVEGLLNP
jgi:excisionase family DNA binding protein